MKTLVINTLGLAGLAAIGAGAWWIYPPASLLLLGALMLAGSVWGAMNTPVGSPGGVAGDGEEGAEIR